MAQEIERKFLIDGDFRPYASARKRIIQGYLSSHPERNVRIRIAEDKAFLTIKGRSDIKGISRFEWEKEIDIADAKELIKLCEPGIIDKTRYYVPIGKHCFEVDEFYGENEGLLIAEIELNNEKEVFEKPNWLGQEVTRDKRYYNAQLMKNPYKNWE